MRKLLLFSLFVLAGSIGLHQPLAAQPGLDFGVNFGANFNTLSADEDIFFDGDPGELTDGTGTLVRGQLGLHLGVNFTDMFGVRSGLTLIGYGGRQTLDYTINPATYQNVEEGLDLIRVEGDKTINANDPVANEEEELRIRTELVQLQIPVLFRAQFLEVVKPFVAVGPAFNINVYANQWNDRIEVNNANTDYEVNTNGRNLRNDEIETQDQTYERVFPLNVSLVFMGGVSIPGGLEFYLRYDLGLSNVNQYDPELPDSFSDESRADVRMRSFGIGLAYNFL